MYAAIGNVPRVEGFAAELGAREEIAQDGRARVVFDADEPHLNGAGTLHGGILATLADSAMALAARTSTGDAEVPATSQLTVAFLTPGRAGRVVVEAQVRKQGDHILLCDAEVEQDGRTLVHAVATFAILEH